MKRKTRSRRLRAGRFWYEVELDGVVYVMWMPPELGNALRATVIAIATHDTHADVREKVRR